MLVGYVGDHLPAFLLAVFAKGDRANLSKKEQRMLQEAIKEEIGSYGKKETD